MKSIAERKHLHELKRKKERKLMKSLGGGTSDAWAIRKQKIAKRVQKQERIQMAKVRKEKKNGK